MAKTNREAVDHLENESVIAAWDKGEDDSNPDCKGAKCENCRFRNWGYWLKQDEVCCNMSGLIMKRDDFCSYGARYNVE